MLMSRAHTQFVRTVVIGLTTMALLAQSSNTWADGDKADNNSVISAPVPGGPRKLKRATSEPLFTPPSKDFVVAAPSGTVAEKIAALNAAAARTATTPKAASGPSSGVVDVKDWNILKSNLVKIMFAFDRQYSEKILGLYEKRFLAALSPEQLKVLASRNENELRRIIRARPDREGRSLFGKWLDAIEKNPNYLAEQLRLPARLATSYSPDAADRRQKELVASLDQERALVKSAASPSGSSSAGRRLSASATAAVLAPTATSAPAASSVTIPTSIKAAPVVPVVSVGSAADSASAPRAILVTETDLKRALADRPAAPSALTSAEVKSAPITPPVLSADLKSELAARAAEFASRSSKAAAAIGAESAPKPAEAGRPVIVPPGTVAGAVAALGSPSSASSVSAGKAPVDTGASRTVADLTKDRKGLPLIRVAPPADATVAESVASKSATPVGRRLGGKASKLATGLRNATTQGLRSAGSAFVAGPTKLATGTKSAVNTVGSFSADINPEDSTKKPSVFSKIRKIFNPKQKPLEVEAVNSVPGDVNESRSQAKSPKPSGFFSRQTAVGAAAAAQPGVSDGAETKPPQSTWKRLMALTQKKQLSSTEDPNAQRAQSGTVPVEAAAGEQPEPPASKKSHGMLAPAAVNQEIIKLQGEISKYVEANKSIWTVEANKTVKPLVEKFQTTIDDNILNMKTAADTFIQARDQVKKTFDSAKDDLMQKARAQLVDSKRDEARETLKEHAKLLQQTAVVALAGSGPAGIIHQAFEFARDSNNDQLTNAQRLMRLKQLDQQISGGKYLNILELQSERESLSKQIPQSILQAHDLAQAQSKSGPYFPTSSEPGIEPPATTVAGVTTVRSDHLSDVKNKLKHVPLHPSLQPQQAIMHHAAEEKKSGSRRRLSGSSTSSQKQP